MNKKQHNATWELLASMMVEPVGRSILDSGDAYGVSYERRRGIDWDDEPEATLKIDEYGVDVTVSMFPFLLSRLEPAVSLNEMLDEWLESDDSDQSRNEWQWPYDFLRQLREEDANGEMRNVDVKLVGTTNTYNGESLLDGVFQYSVFEVGSSELFEFNDQVVALWVHGGCDVRGGYTYPRFFYFRDDDYGLVGVADAEVVCDSGNHYWSTYNGCNWNFENNAGPIANDDKEGMDLSTARTEGSGKTYCPLCDGELFAYVMQF